MSTGRWSTATTRTPDPDILQAALRRLRLPPQDLQPALAVHRDPADLLAACRSLEPHGIPGS
jgi:hypothetical protein